MHDIGDTWHEFDLHIHTPYSKETEYGNSKLSETWDRFIGALEGLRPECKMIGINDYWSIDGYKRVVAEKNKGKIGNIDTIVPVVELRLKQGATKNGVANMHIAFDPAIEVSQIETKFLNRLYCDYEYDGLVKHLSYSNQSDLKFLGRQIIALNFVKNKSEYKVGRDSFSVDIALVDELLRQEEFDGKILKFMGGVEWKELRSGQLPEKLSLSRRVDAFFVASPDRDAFEKMQESVRVFTDRPLIHGSDAHRFDDQVEKVRYLGAGTMWARTNGSFASLKFAIKNGRSRLNYGIPREIEEKRSANILRKIHVDRSASGPEFKYNFELNPGYVAVIGNRGQGKSTIVDWVAYVGGADREISNFSFLNGKRYPNTKEYTAPVEARWADGAKTRRVWKKPAETIGARVDYFPQSYLDRICANDPGSVQGDELKKLIYDIVFRRIRDPRGFETLEDLLADSVDKGGVLRNGRDQIARLAEELSREFHRVRRLRGYNLEEIRKDIEEQISGIESSGEAAPDKSQAQISLDRDLVEASEEAGHGRIESLAAGDRKVASFESELTSSLESISRFLTELEDYLIQHLGSLGNDLLRDFHFQESTKALVGDLRKAALADASMFRSRLGAANIEFNNQQAMLEFSKKILNDRQMELIAESENAETLSKLRHGPTEPAEDRWSLDGIRKLESELQASETRIQELVEKLETESRRVVKLVSDEVAAYGQFIESEIESSIVELENLSFVPWVENVSPATVVEKKFDRSRSSSKEILEFLESGCASLVTAGALNVESLDAEYFPQVRKALKILQCQPPDELFRKGHIGSATVIETICDIYSFSKLRAAVTVGLNDMPLRSLSPGQRGLLLLMFVLYVDNSSNVLVFDQPEDNLDNVSIRSLLLPAIEYARIRRQVIVVSHNANIGVLGDPDQVLCMEIKDGVFSGVSGSLFDPDIRSRALETLEGAEEAFRARSERYGISMI